MHCWPLALARGLAGAQLHDADAVAGQDARDRDDPAREVVSAKHRRLEFRRPRALLGSFGYSADVKAGDRAYRKESLCTAPQDRLRPDIRRRRYDRRDGVSPR